MQPVCDDFFKAVGPVAEATSSQLNPFVRSYLDAVRTDEPLNQHQTDEAAAWISSLATRGPEAAENVTNRTVKAPPKNGTKRDTRRH